MAQERRTTNRSQPGADRYNGDFMSPCSTSIPKYESSFRWIGFEMRLSRIGEGNAVD